jgi:hypothetical protein
MYYALGILPTARGRFIVCPADELIAGDLKQTSSKMQAHLESAEGGVLLIRQAHTCDTARVSTFPIFYQRPAGRV